MPATNSYDCSLTWTALMMWHVRRVAESDEHNDLFSMSYRRLHWPIQLVSYLLRLALDPIDVGPSPAELRPHVSMLRPFDPLVSPESPKKVLRLTIF